jgi:outer membrane lipoprotein LolB
MQTWHASFELQGSPEAGQLTLLNPLGSIVAQLQWGYGGALLLSNGETKESSSLDALVKEIVGTALPVYSLFDWLDGKASAAQGWQVDFSALDKGRLIARREAPEPAVELRVALTRQ